MLCPFGVRIREVRLYIKNSSESFQKIKPPKAIEIQLSHHTLEVLFKSLVCSSLEYADVVWDGCSESDGIYIF